MESFFVFGGLGLLGIGLTVVIIICWIVVVICLISILATAFRTSVWWGLACFIPFGTLAFVITHWDDTKKAFVPAFCVSLAFILLRMVAGGLTSMIGENTKVLDANIRTVQVAAEAYSTDHGGSYPVNIELFQSYFPGGDHHSKSGNPLENPFNHTTEWPVMGSVKDVNAARQEAPGDIKPGVIEYSVIFDDQHHPVAYAVRAGDRNGHALTDKNHKHTLVISNQ